MVKFEIIIAKSGNAKRVSVSILGWSIGSWEIFGVIIKDVEIIPTNENISKDLFILSKFI